MNSQLQEKSKDLRAVLSHPAVYELFRWMVGGGTITRKFIEYIPLFSGVRVLDIGCGPASLFKFLPKDICYVGYDMDPGYINYAKEKYGDVSEFHCKKISEVQPHNINSFDVVTSIGVVHHLDDREAAKLFKIAFDSLKPGGCFVTLDPVFTYDQSKIARFIISKDRGDYVRNVDKYLELSRLFFKQAEHTILHNMLRIPYTHLIMKCIK